MEKSSIWWMSCQQHIRALRVMLNSNTADKEAEIPLRKCVALYMAQIKAHSSLQDQKVLHNLSGEAPFLNQSILISSNSFYHCNSHPRFLTYLVTVVPKPLNESNASNEIQADFLFHKEE